MRPELLSGHEHYAENLAIEVVDSASHWVIDERPDLVTARALQLFGEAS